MASLPSSSNKHCLFCLALLFLLIAIAASSSSSFLSYDALTAGKFSGAGRLRSLLQAKKDCPIDMEGKNYTIITSKCKGPNYPPSVCCNALLEFCCDFVDQLNDMSNNCAETMFSYINLYGQYPPGLFANQCKDGKDGLSCDSIAAQKEKDGIKTSNSSSASPPPAVAAALPLLALPPLIYFFL
ncbi:GPI-anchored protein LLG1-like [Momordica charantia]|uniref:GPI-anchored protein LLG1-like n=1 Tax=Momordica charantia TaxID=3673 RepID=A0A6J1D2W6_MOMCH|nr:GPI-anchored protein LLG1-like [Momordica charantia]